MKIVDAGYEILDTLNGEEILKKIERVARVCYKSEDKITEGSAEKMVRALIKSNHMAMLEHYSFSVKFICDRGVSHEIVRPRVASYPDAYGAERVSITGVQMDDLTLFDWEAQKPLETEAPFTFTGYEYLDQITPQ